MHTNWCDITKKKYQNREPYEQYDRNTHTHKNDGFCLVTQTLIFITLLTSEFGWFDEHVLLPLILCDNFFFFRSVVVLFFCFLEKAKMNKLQQFARFALAETKSKQRKQTTIKNAIYRKRRTRWWRRQPQKKHHPNTEKKSIMNIYGEILRLKY